MEKQNIQNAYNLAAKQYAESLFHELDGKPLDRLLLNRFAAGISPEGIVCDIGCGPGQTSGYLHSQGVNVIGIDLSQEMINEARRLLPELRFETGDMFSLDFPDNYFEGINAFYCIVNIPPDHLSDAFREIFRVLMPGGSIFITFHVGTEKTHVDDFFKQGIGLDFYRFDEKMIMEKMESIGFHITESLVRYPYKEEYPTRRAYITGQKPE